MDTMITRTFLVLAFMTLLSPLGAEAAMISLDPGEGSFGPGDTFVATIRLDLAQGECINAGELTIRYPKEWMRASAVSTGESIFSLWTGAPQVDTENGVIRISGGIPAGYCGRVLGDPGDTNVIAKIAFLIPGNQIGGPVATGDTPVSIVFDPIESRVLLNDGFGTPAELSFGGATYMRVLQPIGKGNEWLSEVQADTFPPESFPVTIVQDRGTLGGKYFIVFSTVDKQSGILHYQVREDDPLRLEFDRLSKDPATFSEAMSPYTLRDQELRSRITVRAYDHNGNYEETIVAPQNGTGTPLSASVGGGKLTWMVVGGGLLALVGFAMSVLIVRRWRRSGADVAAMPSYEAKH
jgi:hypothetical protein